MKVVSAQTKRIVTLELTGEDLEKYKGAWKTLEQYYIENELSEREMRAFGTALELLGAVV